MQCSLVLLKGSSLVSELLVRNPELEFSNMILLPLFSQAKKIAAPRLPFGQCIQTLRCGEFWQDSARAFVIFTNRKMLGVVALPFKASIALVLP